MYYYNFPLLIRFKSIWWTQSFSHWSISYSQRFSFPTCIKHVHSLHCGHFLLFPRTDRLNIDERKLPNGYVIRRRIVSRTVTSIRIDFLLFQFTLNSPAKISVNYQFADNQEREIPRDEGVSLVSHFSFSDDALHQRIN